MATNGEGIDALAAAMDQYLNNHQLDEEKRLRLLTEKSWRLIQEKSMKGRSKQQLKEALSEAMLLPGFNLYVFADTQFQELTGSRP